MRDNLSISNKDFSDFCAPEGRIQCWEADEGVDGERRRL